jgi:hypothetical protein
MNVDAGSGHFLKFGVDMNDLEIFNLFAINATGSIFFRNLDDFENGRVATGFFSSVFGSSDDLVGGALGGFTIASSLDGDINNAAARFNRTIYSFYAQDEWEATDQLSLTAGIRVQLYDGDAPRANPNFLARYGFTNANSFARLDPVILPRFSATYNFDNEGFFSSSRVTGGVGVFSGGDPVVFYSNAFSNDGFASVNGDFRDPECAGALPTDPVTGQQLVVQGGQFTGFPGCAVSAAANMAANGGGNLDSTDPDFDVPTVVRANLGFQSTVGTETGFFSDWNLNLDYIYSRFNDTLAFTNLSAELDTNAGLNGFTIDGRPIYRSSNGRGNEIQLTNGPSSASHVVSAVLAKSFKSGLFTENGSSRFNIGYAFTDSESVFDNASSRAVSNYGGTALFDRQGPIAGRSAFETRHNITASFFLREEFIEGFDTGIGIFFRAREGQPYSLTFDGRSNFAILASGGDSDLLYIPTGVGDPNVAYADAGFFDDATGNFVVTQTAADAEASLNAYIDGRSCISDFRGRSIARNSCRNDWHYDLDLRFSQELPFIGSLTNLADDRIELFVDFENFLNLLDSGANIRRSRGRLVDLVDAGGFDPNPADPLNPARLRSVDAQGRYIISGFNPDDDNNIGISSSAWRIQIGARYEF